MNKQWFVYILSSNSRVLYIGVTNDIDRRLHEHKNHLLDGFTKRYDVTTLVYYEIHNDPQYAIDREKKIKKWNRKKKLELIESMNPKWEDLSGAWER